MWEAVVNHPEFDLGRREFSAFVTLLDALRRHAPKPSAVIHLGVGDGRECPKLLEALSPQRYILVDYSPVYLEKAKSVLTATSVTRVETACGDIEVSGQMKRIRADIDGADVLWLLIGNGSIFANQRVDDFLRESMRPGDLIAMTLEMPHSAMFDSYKIEPVGRMLSRSGHFVDPSSAEYYFDQTDSCLKISVDEQVIFASYKPHARHLTDRLMTAGLSPVVVEEYSAISMLGALFKKECSVENS